MRKSLTLVGSALIAAIAVGAEVTIEMQREASVAAYDIAVSKLGNGMAAQTEHALAAVDRVLRTLPAMLLPADATDEQIKGVLRGSQAAEVLDDRQKRLPNIDALMLVDADGMIATVAGAWPTRSPDVSGSEYFRHFSTGAEQGMFVGAPMRRAVDGAWISVMARRMTDSAGHFAGVAVAELSLDDMQEFYRMAMPTGRSVSVIRTDGILLVRYPPIPDKIGTRVTLREWYTLVAKGGGEYSSPGAFENVPSLVAVHPLHDFPIVVDASVTQAEVLAGWRKERGWVVVGGVASAVGVLMLLRLLAAQFRRIESSEMSLAAKNQQLETAHRQLDAALSNMSQGLVFFDRQSVLIVCNRRYGEIYGLPPEATRPGTSLAEIVDHCVAVGSIPDMSRAEYLEARGAVNRAGQPHDSVLTLRNGRTIAVCVRPLPDGGWVTTHEDITERQAAEAKIAFIAQHDALTGLANRALFQEKIGQALAGARRGTEFAVLFLDLDRFKSINDTLGHQVGDGLLRGVAARLLTAVRDIDTVARLGGDEFVILQIGVRSPEDAAHLARRVLQTFTAPHIINGHHIVAATSIGVAVSTSDGDTADALIRNADMALYIAKAEGRGTFRFFEPEMDAKAQNRHRLEHDLRQALERREFELHYQPIINLQSGRISAFEALLRWKHPDRGLILPAEFIPIAEDSRLIVPIGEWVLTEACREAATWQDDIHVAVNLSPMQFRDGALVRAVTKALAASGLAAGRLELEITETVLLKHTDANSAILHQLRDRGIIIAMDDFGVGYSSLSYLRHFPFDKIKIDQLFTRDITQRQDVVLIMRAIIGLCRDLGIRTTVEGVETFDQLAILLAEGSTEVQGYLIGRPKPADQIAGVIADAALMWSCAAESFTARTAVAAQ